MSANLQWMEVLNEQATWTSIEDLIQWLSILLGRRPTLTKKTIEEFQSGLNDIRRQVSCLHFQQPLDLSSIDAELDAVKLELVHPIKQTGAYLSVLPALHARLRSQDDDSFLIALKQTLVLQFAQFVAEALSNTSSPGVARCEGLYRESGSTDISPAGSLPPDLELLWRKEIAALTDAGLESSLEVLRCADYFPARAKGRFCSDECRFRTFQLKKQLSEPGYLAAKQKRYRAKQDKARS